jgi:hypothetical protein
MARPQALAEGLDGEDGEAEPTLREQLLEARDEVVGNQEGADGDANQRGNGAGRSGDADQGGGGRQRDESGRFAPKARDGSAASGSAADAQQPSAAAAPSAAELAAQDQAAGRAQAPADGQAPQDLNLAPRLWSQQAKAEWSKLPETVRKEIAHREQAMHRQLTAQDQERELARSFKGTVGNFQDVIQREGVHPVKFMENALSTIRALQSGTPVQKATILGHLARQYGIDPRMFAGVAPGGQPPAPGAPAAGAPAQSFQLPPALAQMATEWDQFKAQQQRDQQAAQEQMASSVMTEIETFQANPANRYFSEVKDHMRVLLAGGAAQTLAEAYDQAIYARPDIRDQLIKEREAGLKAAADKARQVQQARARGVSVRSRGGGAASTTAGSERTLREELAANFAEARSRV